MSDDSQQPQEGILVKFIALALLLVSFALAQAALPPVALPQDEAPHSNQLEWWYYTGHLDTVDSVGLPVHYAFESTVFQMGKLVLGHGEMDLGNFSLINVTDKKYDPYEVASIPAFASENLSDAFDIHFKDKQWQISGSQGFDRIHVLEGTQGVSLDLSAAKPAALYGDRGIIDYGGQVSLAYYSRTRMLATGEVYDHGVSRQVKGQVWMDHQWGDADMKKFRWKWFSAQFDDGRDLMIYQVWSNVTGRLVKAYGAMIGVNGVIEELPDGGITVNDLQTWAAPNGTQYPVAVALGASLGDHDLSLVTRAYFPDQRFRTHSLIQLAPVYWEGACEITGMIDGEEVHGRGFSEFAGYE